MLKIEPNKLKSNGVIIPEVVYIRTVQSTGVGVVNSVNPNNINLDIQGIAWLKSVWDVSNTSGSNLPIDGLINTFSTSMPSADAIAGVNFAYFNEIFKQIIIDTLGLTDADISIVSM